MKTFWDTAHAQFVQIPWHRKLQVPLVMITGVMLYGATNAHWAAFYYVITMFAVSFWDMSKTLILSLKPTLENIPIDGPHEFVKGQLNIVMGFFAIFVGVAALFMAYYSVAVSLLVEDVSKTHAVNAMDFIKHLFLCAISSGI